MTITDDEYRVYLMPFPGDINGAVRVDEEGFPTIYINEYLSPEARKRAFKHELRHILRDDLYNDNPLEEIEED